MNKVTVVTLNRVEGPAGYCGKMDARTWSEAETVVRMWARTAPEDGYEKVDFTVEWDDGSTYKGEMELERHHAERGNVLIDHVIKHLTSIRATAVETELAEAATLYLKRFFYVAA